MHKFKLVLKEDDIAFIFWKRFGFICYEINHWAMELNGMLLKSWTILKPKMKVFEKNKICKVRSDSKKTEWK